METELKNTTLTGETKRLSKKIEQLKYEFTIIETELKYYRPTESTDVSEEPSLIHFKQYS